MRFDTVRLSSRVALVPAFCSVMLPLADAAPVPGPAAPMTTTTPPAQRKEPAIPPAAPLVVANDHTGSQTSIITAAAVPAVASSLAGLPNWRVRMGYPLIW